MSDRRTQITIEVLGLSDLQAANNAMSRHNTLVQRLTASYQGLNAITGSVASGMTTINTTFDNSTRTINATVNTVNKFGASLQGANTSGMAMLGTMLQYRLLGAVFSEVIQGVQATTTALMELEKQTARVQRVSPTGSGPLIRSIIASESTRTGASAQDTGEALYQLQTGLATRQRLPPRYRLL